MGDGNAAIGSRGNNPLIQSFCSSTPSVAVSIKPPIVAKNKGSGRRLKGGKEKSMQSNLIRGRKCHGCDKRDGHDSRNCPILKAAEERKAAEVNKA
nr:protein FAR1-RELATED SEQUENCE 5-like [Ipomoea batatas]